MAHPKKIDVRVVVEGGGDSAVQDGVFREGYGKFLKRFVPTKIGDRPVALEVIRGKGRTSAADKFATQRNLHPNALMILLIDSEGPVPHGTQIWPYLKDRDGIQKPEWADESHVYLMVQCVETWIVADREALKAYYGSHLSERILPVRTNLEEEPKDDVQKKLERATANHRSPYKHGDSAYLIAKIDPAKISNLPHGKRLQTGIVDAIEEFVSSNP